MTPVSELSKPYSNEERVEELLRVRGTLSPDRFNQRVADSVLAVKRPSSNPDFEGVGSYHRGLMPPVFNGNCFANSPIASTECRLYCGSRSLYMIKLPPAVQKSLGYNDVETIADWVKKLPIAKKIIWNKSEKCTVTPTVYTSLVPMNSDSDAVSVSVEAHGRGRDTWVYLGWSREALCESVETFTYDGIHIIVSGRNAEQNEYNQMDQEQRLAKSVTIKPLQATWDNDAIADATFVTIAIKLNRYPEMILSNFDQSSSEMSQRDMREKKYPVTFPSATGLFGYDGNFILSPEHNYMSVTTAVGVVVPKEADKLPSYFDTLCQRFDRALEEAVTITLGPTAEKVKDLMLKKLSLPPYPDPVVTLLEKVNIVRLDYTGLVMPSHDSDGDVSVRSTKSWVIISLPTSAPKQEGQFWENWPQVIRFHSDKDAHRPAEERELAIFNWTPETDKYVRHIHTISGCEVSLEELKQGLFIKGNNL